MTRGLAIGLDRPTIPQANPVNLKRISREEGISLVEKYKHKDMHSLRDLPFFLNWLGIDSFTLQNWVNKYRDKSIWKETKENFWELLDEQKTHINDEGIEGVRLDSINQELIFRDNFRSETPEDKVEGYIRLSRGWED